MTRVFRTELLGEPALLRELFTDKGRVRPAYGGGASFQIDEIRGRVMIWTVGPMGWWHDFQEVPRGLAFDAALARTHLPSHYGWKVTGDIVTESVIQSLSDGN
jgi:hypothetical protein